MFQVWFKNRRAKCRQQHTSSKSLNESSSDKSTKSTKSSKGSKVSTSCSSKVASPSSPTSKYTAPNRVPLSSSSSSMFGNTSSLYTSSQIHSGGLAGLHADSPGSSLIEMGGDVNGLSTSEPPSNGGVSQGAGEHQYPSPTITPSNNNNLGLSDPSSYLNAAANLWTAPSTLNDPTGTASMGMQGHYLTSQPPLASVSEGSPTSGAGAIKQEMQLAKVPNSSPPISAAVSPHPSSHSSTISGGGASTPSGLTNGGNPAASAAAGAYQSSSLSTANNGAHFAAYGNTHTAYPPPPHHNPYAAAYDLSYFGNHPTLNQQYASHMSANVFRGMDYGDSTTAYSPERYHQLL